MNNWKNNSIYSKVNNNNFLKEVAQKNTTRNKKNGPGKMKKTHQNNVATYG